MTDFSSVMKTTELASGEMKRVTVDGTELIVANVDGQFCAFGGLCPHEDAPLEDGDLEGDVVTCPWHFTQFNVRTGKAIEGVTDEPIAVYEVRVEGEDIQIANPGDND